MAKNQSTLYYGSAKEASDELDHSEPTNLELRAALMNALNRIDSLEHSIKGLNYQLSQAKP